ncbi:MAG: hypothetical protein D6794_01380, partial [Deltaproteobacteria bacterium]
DTASLFAKADHPVVRPVQVAGVEEGANIYLELQAPRVLQQDAVSSDARYPGQRGLYQLDFLGP